MQESALSSHLITHFDQEGLVRKYPVVNDEVKKLITYCMYTRFMNACQVRQTPVEYTCRVTKSSQNIVNMSSPNSKSSVKH